MLDGFPKKIATTKIKRGHYRIDRDDGYSVEVIHGIGREPWFQAGNIVARRASLNLWKYDLRHGYTARDQLAK